MKKKEEGDGARKGGDGEEECAAGLFVREECAHLEVS